MRSRTAIVAIVTLLWPALALGQAPANAAHAAADTLVTLLRIEEAATAGARASIGQQVAQNPDLEAYRDILESWSQKHLSGPEFRAAVVSLYAETFAVPELRDLIAFYRSQTGQKLASLQPTLVARSAAIGQQIAADHQAELEAAVEARNAELQQGKRD